MQTTADRRLIEEVLKNEMKKKAFKSLYFLF